MLEIKLSERKHMPALFLPNSRVAFPLWAYNFIKQFEKHNFAYDEVSIHSLAETRLGYYKPPFSLKGKTILDAGACCGETAWYYLDVLGAAKVYCIECDPLRVMKLQVNKYRSGLNFEVIGEPLKMEHFKLPVDFIKCDVEGQEVLLLEYFKNNGVDKPCVLEVHNQFLKEQFQNLGFHIVRTFSDICSLMTNYRRR